MSDLEKGYFIYCAVLTIAYLIMFTHRVYHEWNTDKIESTDIVLGYLGGTIAVFTFVPVIILVFAPILIPIGIVNYIRKGKFID